MFIRRQGSYHYIIELRADVQLTLNSRKDYLTGDNSDIIPTDTIKNTVHALAKLKGVGHLPLLIDTRAGQWAADCNLEYKLQILWV